MTCISKSNLYINLCRTTEPLSELRLDDIACVAGCISKYMYVCVCVFIYIEGNNACMIFRNSKNEVVKHACMHIFPLNTSKIKIKKVWWGSTEEEKCKL